MIPVIKTKKSDNSIDLITLSNKFQENGCVLIKGFFKKELSYFLDVHHEIMPNYKIGESLIKEAKTRNSKWFNEVSKFNYKNNNLRIDGVPNKYRLMHGKGPYNIDDCKNVFYGKRASLNLSESPRDIIKKIYDHRFKNLSAKLLNTDLSNLCYYLGSMNTVYPGYPGESGMLHIDTFGFTGGDHTLRPKNTRDTPFLNIIVYLTEANNECAGTRVVTGSHKKYLLANNAVKNAFKFKGNSNHIHQRELYDEVIQHNPELGHISSVHAEPGDVFVFSSSTIHGIPGNFSDEKERRVIILNVGRTNDNFGKLRSVSETKKLHDRLKPTNVGLGCISMQSKYLNKFKSARNKIKIIARNKFHVLRNKKQQMLNKFYSTKGKKLLNIGAGDYFNLNGWTRLDYNGETELIGIRNKRLTDVNFDLLSKKPLPFNDESFDGIYSSHTFEHLHKEDANRITKECFRILKPGGVLRIITPSIDKYFDAYDNLDLNFFNWVRNKGIYRHDSLLRIIVREFAHLIVDRYSDEELKSLYIDLGREKFITHVSDLCDKAKNEFKTTLPDTHKSAWSIQKLKSLIENNGGKFNNNASQLNSALPAFCGTQYGMLNSTRPHLSIYAEGIK